jgi:O-antigen ligase
LPAAPPSGVQPVVRWALYAYIFSIPFEMPQRSIPVEIPTLVGSVFLLATLLHRRAAYRYFPAPLTAFATYLWVFVASALVNLASHELNVLNFFLELLQALLLFWTTANLLSNEPVRIGALRALALACGLRAVLQVAGIASTQRALWTGGYRVSALGQNVNLSALILTAGLLAALALPNVRDPKRRGWPAAVRWPLVVVIAVAIVQTGSRGGLIALATGVMMFLLSGPTLWARVRNAVAAVLVLGMLGFGAYHSEAMRNRWSATLEEGTLAGRERIYPALLVMLRERPALGWGPVENQYELERRLQDPGYIKRDAHNLVLELLTSTGFAGTIPFLIGLVLCLARAWRARRARGVLPFAMLLAILTGTMSGTWIVSKILWLVLAHGEAASRRPSLASGDA